MKAHDEYLNIDYFMKQEADEFLFTFSAAEDQRRLDQMLNNNPGLLNGKSGQYQNSLLHRAIEQNRLQTFIRKDLVSDTKCFRYGMCEYLLDEGAKHMSNIPGNTPFHLTCIFGGRKILSLLVKHGAELESRNIQGEYPLHLAANSGNIEAMTFLLEQGVNVETRGWKGNSALHEAADNAHLDALRILMNTGLDVGVMNDDNETALHLAAGVSGEHGGVDVLDFLIAHGADINAM